MHRRLRFFCWKNECIWGRCSQMCGGETLFSCRPLLSLCCGLLVGFIPVQDDIIVQAEGEKEGRTEGRKEGKKRMPSKDAAWNPFIACLHYSAAQERNKAPDQICHTFIPPSPLFLVCRRGRPRVQFCPCRYSGV